MSALDMTTGEMLVVALGLQAKAEIFRSYPLTSTFPLAIDAAVTQLMGAAPPPSVTSDRGARLRAADRGVDQPLILYSEAIDWLEKAFPAEEPLWTRLRYAVLPKGLRAIVQSSYRNEVGEMQRLDVHLTEALRRDLGGIRLHTRTALDFVEDAIRGGRALKIEIDAPQAPPPPEEESERAARATFTQLLPALRTTARSAKWSEEHHEAVFGPIETAITEATRRAEAERRARLAEADRRARAETPS